MDTEKIDLYLNNSMSPQEKDIFEAELAQNNELFEEVQLQKQLILAIKTTEMENILREEEKRYSKQTSKLRKIFGRISYTSAIVAVAACIAAYIVLSPLVQNITDLGNLEFNKYYSSNENLIIRGTDENIDLLNEATYAIDKQEWQYANKCLNQLLNTNESIDCTQLLELKDEALWLKALVAMKRGRYFTAKRILKKIECSQSIYADSAHNILSQLEK